MTQQETLTARSIKDDLDHGGITNLVNSAQRGIHTMPDGFVDTYEQLNTLVADNSDRFGKLMDWKAEKAASELTLKLYQATGGGNADRVIIDHLRPALKQYLDQFRAHLDKAGQYADHTDAGALLSQPDDVRRAWLDLTDSYADYSALRASWLVCRKRNANDYAHTGTIDPDGLTSPLAEVANIPDIVSDWKLAYAGRKPWPWSATAHHVRLRWLIENGAELWLPTGYEQDQAWAKYNPGRRVAA
ncbi:MAG: hypothetical protein JWO67_4829 [Streptosporangiaceae bacterium]|nr:hypothetical protein [Streptosporangiaceae bacterium]